MCTADGIGWFHGMIEDIATACVEVTISYSGETERWTVRTGTALEVESDDLGDAVQTMWEQVEDEIEKERLGENESESV